MTALAHAPTAAPALPAMTWVGIFLRLLAIQASWNYERMLGTGIAFCLEPALRHLPGGRQGEAYRAAMARHSGYFNAHPYLTGAAVGALARAELEGASAAKIERFRRAVCGPLGSVGDLLVWAGWLPFCSLLALAAFGLGAGPGAVLLIFLGLYNVGHLGLRIWALRVGWRDGLLVGKALGAPLLRQGHPPLARMSALLAGIALPLALDRVIGPGRALLGGVIAATVLGAILLARLHGRAEGWRVALVALTALALYSIAR